MDKNTPLIVLAVTLFTTAVLAQEAPKQKEAPAPQAPHRMEADPPKPDVKTPPKKEEEPQAEPPPEPPPKKVEPPKDRRIVMLLEPAGKSDGAQTGQLIDLLGMNFERRGVTRIRMIAPFDKMSLKNGLDNYDVVRKDMVQDASLVRWAEHETALNRSLLALRGALGAAPLDALVGIYQGFVATRLKDGDSRMAEDYLLTAMHLNPNLTERDFFGQRDSIALFKSVRATLAARSLASVRVETRPRGAEVYVGDVLKGHTPMALKDLKQGTHLIRIKKDGYYSHGWMTDLNPSVSMTLSHKLRPMPGQSKVTAWVKLLHKPKGWKRGGPKMLEAIAGVKRIFNATDVVVAKVKRTKKGYVIKGSYAPWGKEPGPLETEAAIDASLLRRISTMTYEWVP